MKRAERRAEVRAAGKRWRDVIEPSLDDATCTNCGRHLDDGPPDAPTLSLDIGGGQIVYACGHCAPGLMAMLGGMREHG